MLVHYIDHVTQVAVHVMTHLYVPEDVLCIADEVETCQVFYNSLLLIVHNYL